MFPFQTYLEEETMLGIATRPTCGDVIQKIAGAQPIRDKLHITARTSQAFFGAGLVISAVGLCMHFHPLLSGGSFLFHGPVVLAHLLEAITCYDLARVSANIASVFHSCILSQSAKNRLGSSFAASVAVDILAYFEKGSLESTNTIKTPKELTEATTYGTLIIRHLSPYIERFLSTQR